MATATAAPGLTTTKAPFIEQAQAKGELYITQPYELYSEENHDAWRRLFSRMLPRWEQYANPHS
jgi:phenylalanine-4-hydroxylase